MILLVLYYLGVPLVSKYPPIFRALLTLFSFLITLLTGMSRILDNKHHPTDVLSGWIIGVLVAIGIVSLDF